MHESFLPGNPTLSKCFLLVVGGGLRPKLPGRPLVWYRYWVWLVVWNMNFIFPFSWEWHHPN